MYGEKGGKYDAHLLLVVYEAEAVFRLAPSLGDVGVGIETEGFGAVFAEIAHGSVEQVGLNVGDCRDGQRLLRI